jgi:arginine N-succinyltransferase
MRDEILAELLPPLEPDGTSYLWEAIGRRFTGLTYREADRLSKRNKEFIRGLFPDHVYATLLSDEARRIIGEVGAQTRGVEKMLRRVGFHYAARIDPFDGGPHFLARTDDITLLQRSSELVVETVGPPAGPPTLLVARQSAVRPFFVAAVASRTPAGGVHLAAGPAEQLQVQIGDRVWALPVPL